MFLINEGIQMYFIFQITLTNLISVDERLLYRPHPDNPEV